LLCEGIYFLLTLRRIRFMRFDLRGTSGLTMPASGVEYYERREHEQREQARRGDSPGFGLPHCPTEHNA
jgi:hypothetical protein